MLSKLLVQKLGQKKKERNEMKNLFLGTIIMGTAGLLSGMAHSTFRHYYHKYADIEDMKTFHVQDVNLVSNAEGEL